MILGEQLRKLSRLQSFDNKMDSLYKEGLPSDTSGHRVGTKQKQFIRQRRTMLRKLDTTLVRCYERLRDSRIKADAVVPVVNGVCRGCHMAVTKSLVAELIEGSSLVTCEHCGRILYIK